MFAVIFEFEPHATKGDDYLALARLLRPELEAIDGFLENTRYRSRSRAGLLLSVSLWRDEKAVIRWRTHAAHHQGQVRGRREILSGYRLRVGEVVSVANRDGTETPRPQRLDVTEVGDATAIRVDLWRGPAEPEPDPPETVAGDVFDGVVDPADRLAMACCRTLPANDASPRRGRRLWIRVIRDYGLSDRREAPQFHAPVA